MFVLEKRKWSLLDLFSLTILRLYGTVTFLDVGVHQQVVCLFPRSFWVFRQKAVYVTNANSAGVSAGLPRHQCLPPSLISLSPEFDARVVWEEEFIQSNGTHKRHAVCERRGFAEYKRCCSPELTLPACV